MTLLVEDVMLKDIMTVDVGQPLKYAESLMKYFGVGCLIVLREKEPVGIITLGDIERWADSSSNDSLLTPVEEVMSEPLIWVSNDTQLQEAHESMIRNNIKKLPVIGYLSRGPTLLGILERVEIEFEYPELVQSFY